MEPCDFRSPIIHVITPPNSKGKESMYNDKFDEANDD